MTSPQGQHKPGLPPPPAPTRRDANPWKLSDTARKREPPPAGRVPDLLEILMKDAGPGESSADGQPTPQPDEEPAQPLAIGRREGIGLWPLIILGIAIMVLLRVLLEARATGNWTGLIAPLLAILFIAHGWWRLRQRRRDASGQPGDPAARQRRD